jgi:hypothetical protein
MLYSFINVDIFMVYCCLKSLSNLILETLHSLDVVLRKSSHAHVGENNIVLLYKSLTVIELLI